MSSSPQPGSVAPTLRKQHPFRRAVLRGLAIILPPLLTIVLFLWAWNTIDAYVLKPIEGGARYILVQINWDVLDRIPQDVSAVPDAQGRVHSFVYKNRAYVPVGKGQWIPKDVHDAVEKDPGGQLPTTAEAYYQRYVTIRWLGRSLVVPVFLCLFILVLYLLGKFLAAGVGRMLWNFFEGLIHRLPIIRNVYSSVKQVTDFVFSEREIEYTRVVAVQYPRKGVWSIGFVTGESMLDIRSAANEPVVSVLMPTSPMPATGFTITVPKSETIDLNITIDQAIQFVVSCGVVVPPLQQQSTETEMQIASAMAQHASFNPNGEDNIALPSATQPRREPRP